MNIIIKQLQGGECKLEVDEKTKILDIKKSIYNKLYIPVQEQKLLLLGRTLADDQTVGSYPSIKNGTKLNLVIKKPESLFDASLKHFKQCGLSETESIAAAKRLVKIVEDKFNKLSWDDIEQLSLNCLIEESGDKLPGSDEHEPENNDTIGL